MRWGSGVTREGKGWRNDEGKVRKGGKAGKGRLQVIKKYR